MSQQHSDHEALRMVLADLERKFPGSVVIDPITDAVSLVGWSLEQFNDPKNDKNPADGVEGIASSVCLPGVARQFSGRAAKNSGDQYLLVGVVNPLTNTPQSTAERDKSGCGGWVRTEQPGSVNQEHKESTCDKHLVPVVKSKFSDRVFHILSRLMFWRR